MQFSKIANFRSFLSCFYLLNWQKTKSAQGQQKERSNQKVEEKKTSFNIKFPIKKHLSRVITLKSNLSTSPTLKSLFGKCAEKSFYFWWCWYIGLIMALVWWCWYSIDDLFWCCWYIGLIMMIVWAMRKKICLVLVMLIYCNIIRIYYIVYNTLEW